MSCICRSDNVKFNSSTNKPGINLVYVLASTNEWRCRNYFEVHVPVHVLILVNLNLNWIVRGRSSGSG